MTKKPLIQTDGFIAEYEEKISSGKYPTKQSAFEAVNTEHEKKYGCVKYSNYNSFRNVRNRKLVN